MLEKSNKILGICGFHKHWKDTNDAYVSIIAVHPDWRQKGLGQNLMAECFNILIDEKVPKVILKTWSENEQLQDIHIKIKT